MKEFIIINQKDLTMLRIGNELELIETKYFLRLDDDNFILKIL